MSARGTTLLRVEGIDKTFHAGVGLFARRRLRSATHAVRDVSLDIQRGEIFGVAGESGSGKSVTAQIIARLWEPDAGRILLDGQDVTRVRGADLRRYRRRVQIVFQDPYDSLNPRLTLARLISEPLEVHGIGDRAERLERAEAALVRVGLNPPGRFLRCHPHELSGGELQRACIARALILDPELLIADEPTSMLDVSVRAGIINLLAELRDTTGLTVVFISHDLATISHLCDRTAIMYRGHLVEIGPADDVLRLGLHPYTAALIAAIPVADPCGQRLRAKVALPASDPRGAAPNGCVFSARCPKRMDVCTLKVPEFGAAAPGHDVACHLHARTGLD